MTAEPTATARDGIGLVDEDEPWIVHRAAPMVDRIQTCVDCDRVLADARTVPDHVDVRYGTGKPVAQLGDFITAPMPDGRLTRGYQPCTTNRRKAP